jgi:hypothetical protein
MAITATHAAIAIDNIEAAAPIGAVNVAAAIVAVSATAKIGAGIAAAARKLRGSDFHGKGRRAMLVGRRLSSRPR